MDTRRTEGKPYVLTENIGTPREISNKKTGETRHKETKRGHRRTVSSNITGYGATHSYEKRGEDRERRPKVHTNKVQKPINLTHERGVEKTIYKDKHYDINIEKPVPNYREVDVPYDVIVETPIEKITEREVLTEKIIEIPIEKHIDVIYEKVVEVPVEKIIEMPVYIDQIVEITEENHSHITHEHEQENTLYTDFVREIDEKDLEELRHTADVVLPVETRYKEEDVEVVI